MSDDLEFTPTVETLALGACIHTIMWRQEDQVETPGGLALALRAQDSTSLRDALTPGTRHGMIYHPSTAKTYSIRAPRIEKPIASLGGAG